MVVVLCINTAVGFLVGSSPILKWPQLGIFVLAALILSRVELLFITSLEIFDPAMRLSQMKEQYARLETLFVGKLSEVESRLRRIESHLNLQ